jgi:transcriptional regulator with XRE-family HTH domain
MPNKNQPADSRLAAIRVAIERKMDELGHTQQQVAEATGVTQSSISRLLSGERKRISKAVLRLCQYAEIDADDVSPRDEAQERASQLLRTIIGDNPAAASAVARVLEVLAPILLSHRPTEKSRSAP